MPNNNEERKESVRIALIRHLMTHANLLTNSKLPIERHPQYKKFDKQSTQVITYLGSEDYLSLVSALDGDDYMTVLRLMRKANDNAAKDAVGEINEQSYFIQKGNRYYFRHSGDGHFIALLREMRLPHRATDKVGVFVANKQIVRELLRQLQPLSEAAAFAKFTINFIPKTGGSSLDVQVEAADAQDATNRAVEWFEHNPKYSIEDYDIAVNKPMSGRKIAVLRDEIMTERSKKGAVKESVLGMTKVPGLSRLRELAGLDIQPVPVLPLGVEDEFVDDMPSEVAAEIVDAPSPPPRPMKDENSTAFAEAVEHLEKAKELIYEMRLTEYRLFCNRADDFCAAVRAMGVQFLDEN